MSVFTLVIGSPTVRTVSLSRRFASHAALVAEHTSSLSPRFVQPGNPLAHARLPPGPPGTTCCRTQPSATASSPAPSTITQQPSRSRLSSPRRRADSPAVLVLLGLA
ncbi:hypothetical protein DIPPA_01923 [Diplonema papillatum]|nr:hypothetical protein DIPPA_01923 [Diplonema papillatum]